MEKTRAALELLYFLSGPAIVIVAAWGLRQLTLSKRIAHTAAKRDAFRLAAEQCTRYLEHIIPLQNELDMVLKEKGCDFITKSTVEFKGKGFVLKIVPPGPITDDLREVLDKAVAVANCLEAFSLFFVTGVAAEDVAFTSVGATYCRTVEELLPFIAMGAKDGKHYQHIMKLFMLWHERQRGAELLLDRSRIEKDLKEIDGKTITPVGLED